MIERRMLVGNFSQKFKNDSHMASQLSDHDHWQYQSDKDTTSRIACTTFSQGRWPKDNKKDELAAIEKESSRICRYSCPGCFFSLGVAWCWCLWLDQLCRLCNDMLWGASWGMIIHRWLLDDSSLAHSLFDNDWSLLQTESCFDFFLGLDWLLHIDEIILSTLQHFGNWLIALCWQCRNWLLLTDRQVVLWHWTELWRH